MSCTDQNRVVQKSKRCLLPMVRPPWSAASDVPSSKVSLQAQFEGFRLPSIARQTLLFDITSMSSMRCAPRTLDSWFLKTKGCAAASPQLTTSGSWHVLWHSKYLNHSKIDSNKTVHSKPLTIGIRGAARNGLRRGF